MSKFDPQAFFNRAKTLVTNTKDTWVTIRGEATSVKELYLSWILIGAAIPPVCQFIGTILFGIKIPLTGITVRPGLFDALFSGLIAYGFSLVGTYILALILSKLAPKFGGQEDLVSTLKLVAYSMTPVWIAGILSLVGLSVLGIVQLVVSCYALYILYQGITILTGVPEGRRNTYFGASILCSMVVMFFVSLLTAAVSPRLPMPEIDYGNGTGRFDSDKFEEGMKQLQNLIPKNN